MRHGPSPRTSRLARVVHLALDACDADLVRTWARAGELPTFARLLDEGAWVETRAPEGFFVSSIWPSVVTSSSPGTHRYTNWVEVEPDTYDLRETTPHEIQGTAFWEVLHDQGLRTAMLDVPHASVRNPDHRGVLLFEWGCHDRHFGPASAPPALLHELAERHGPHPVGCAPPAGARQFAPCDYLHRAGPHRTAVEHEQLWNDLLEGQRRKAAVSLDLLRRGGWDLFTSVLGEAHCVGHQFWHVHDATHPRHDPAVAARLGDPVLEMYRLLDATVADHLDLLGPGTTVYVQLSHGMGPHYDGGHLLEHVLRRLHDADGRAAPPFDPAALDTLDPLPPESIEARDRRARRWSAAPNNTVTGAIRLNVRGRDPHGVLEPGPELDATIERLSSWLLEVVNSDTGEPVVTAVRRTDAVYDRVEGDAFPDLLVEWNRHAPIERVHSPRIGRIEVPYTHWRTGDHHDGGLLLATGPGIRAGRRAEAASVLDIAPTLCAALGTSLPGAEGRPLDELVPARLPARRPRLADARARAREYVRIRLLALLDVPSVLQRLDQAEGRLDLMAQGHHDTRLIAQDARNISLHARGRAEDAHTVLLPLTTDDRLTTLVRLATIDATTAWVDLADVPESTLVSVVMPTYNRAERIPRAVQSVLDQRYTNWELLIVDDGSTDDTAAVIDALADPRIRGLSVSHRGCCGARNAALDAAKGDLIVYLDDDNLLLPLWLKAVVWAFDQRPEIDVVHGARLIDDFERVHDAHEQGGLPWVQFEPFDRERLERSNIADIGVLAHRAGLPEARFDDALARLGDWDLYLRLTADKAPLELPVLAVAYTTDATDRLSRTSESVDRARITGKLRGDTDPRTGRDATTG